MVTCLLCLPPLDVYLMSPVGLGHSNKLHSNSMYYHLDTSGLLFLSALHLMSLRGDEVSITLPQTKHCSLSC